MLATDITVPEPAIPALNLRAVARRLVVPALLAAGAVLGVLLLGGHIHVFADALRRGLSVSPVWVIVGVAFECISLAGYVALLALVAGRATARVGARESAQITFAGAAATRLLPTAGAGGAALALYALRRAGLKRATAARTLLVFMVLLYSVFLASIAISGAALALGLVHGHGPFALSALPAGGATAAIALALVFATVVGGEAGEPAADRSRAANAARLVGGAVRDAIALVRSADRRLLGAIAYWIFDAAVLWAMLHAFGSPPSLPVVVLAYFVGQLANTLPLPGAVSGGMAGVLIAFGSPTALALPAVLTYRTIAVWLPLPAGVAALPGIRATIARWGREDSAAPATA
ncbi:MAG: lysylphosphatidylglycerol synthase domain-containing protein [Solirubrobacteraceae bacterium]